MKKILLQAVLLLTFYFSHAQNDTTWYKVYTGQVGSMDATMHLLKIANTYSGYIWFKQLQWPLQIMGSPQITNTDSVQLSAASTPFFLNLIGLFDGDTYKGYGSLEKDNLPSKKAIVQLKINTGEEFTAFNYYYVSGNAKLPENLKNESTSQYAAATIWPKDNSALSVSIKKKIGLLFKIPSSVSNPQGAMNTAKNQYLASWKKENSKLNPKDASEMGLSLSASQNSNMMVMYENNRTITLADFNSEYSGGAHDMYSTSLYNFEKKSGRILQLKDVLSAEGIKLLPQYLDRVARIQFGIRNQLPLDKNNFFVKEIKPTENFYITSAGIGFLYPPYALKSFADGEINLLIPFSALTKYLQPGISY